MNIKELYRDNRVWVSNNTEYPHSIDLTVEAQYYGVEDFHVPCFSRTYEIHNTFDSISIVLKDGTALLSVDTYADKQSRDKYFIMCVNEVLRQAIIYILTGIDIAKPTVYVENNIAPDGYDMYLNHSLDLARREYNKSLAQKLLGKNNSVTAANTIYTLRKGISEYTTSELSKSDRVLLLLYSFIMSYESKGYILVSSSYIGTNKKIKDLLYKVEKEGYTVSYY